MIPDWVIALMVLYGIVAFATAAGGAIGMADPVNEGDKRLGARILLGSPAWPLLLIHALLKAIAKAKKILKETL